MPKGNFKSITISESTYTKLEKLGRASTVAQTLMKERYDERVRIENIINQLEYIPPTVKIYTP